MTSQPSSVAVQFPLGGELSTLEPLGRGHINTTFHVQVAGREPRSGFVLQRVNHDVFPNPHQVMENWIRVCDHLRAKLAARNEPDLQRRHASPIPAHDGRPYHRDETGAYWRLLPFIEESRTLEGPVSPAQAFEAARAFAHFVRDLLDLPGSPLHITIPDFHDLDSRQADLRDSVRANAMERAEAATREIEACNHWCQVVQSDLNSIGTREIPRRNVHHDGKINNLLFDAEEREALCVIDLDTVMEGTVLSDFGELARTVCCPQPEAVSDLSLLHFDPTLFRALAAGYLSGGADFLSAQEIRALPIAGPLMTLMNAVRFLTDHLNGDTYFPVAHEGQNMERCRAQLRRVELFQEHRNVIEQAVRDAAIDFALPR
ncbi:aminoglycoside phosphotransferase family protein [Myxococcota bacterium]|nr:aminoglycoside phosphotransferase family protein [Myxococcota bacterium]